MMTKVEIEGLFMELGEMARSEGRTVEIAVYGGAALILSFPSRPATRDVDAVMLDDAPWIRNAATTIYERHKENDDDLDEDWLNDGVKGWLSSRDRDPDAKEIFRSYPSEDEAGLRVFVARPEYIFAMKCMAMRIGGVEGNHDIGDIIQLVDHLDIQSPEQAFDIVSKYYPKSQISPKTQFGVEEIFENIAEVREDIRLGARTPWGG